MKMSTKKIINESIARNPLGLKEVFEEAIMERVALALEAKKLDKVNPDALKGDFEDREDKDIDNDGDVDDSDEYLHNRRKTIMKAMKKESVGLDEAMFTVNDIDGMAKEIKSGLKAPFVNVSKSTLGGAERVSIFIKVSLDKPEDWTNNIYQNSRHAMFRVGSDDGSLELSTKHYSLPKFRKAKFKNTKDIIAKINKWIDSASSVKESYDLDEAKMSDIDILRAARRLASVGKDDKTKEFGRGLLAFHTKNGSFTPAQVSGLQNIMKNAGFQLAKESVDLSEAKKDKPAFGSSGGFSYAVNLNGVENEFFKQPFGRQLDAMKKVKEFTSKAKKGYAGAKGKSTLAAVKDWVKLNQPTQFYAKWKSDSSSYKDDSVEIYYMKEANESLNESKEIEKLGAEAFNSGIKRQVVMDPKMKDHIASKDKIAAMKAWYKGWDRENLKD
jgi:hypothetical protein